MKKGKRNGIGREESVILYSYFMSMCNDFDELETRKASQS